jgi:hypothetical protein
MSINIYILLYIYIYIIEYNENHGIICKVAPVCTVGEFAYASPFFHGVASPWGMHGMVYPAETECDDAKLCENDQTIEVTDLYPG